MPIDARPRSPENRPESGRATVPIASTAGIFRGERVYPPQNLQGLTHMLQLKGRTAVVTGGSSGIGAACVTLLRENGAIPVSWDLTGLCDIVCDVSDAKSIQSAIEKTTAKFGCPSLLVVCAGIILPGTIRTLDVADWDKVFSVNMRGVMLSVQAVARQMIASETNGSIVLVSSVNGIVADPGISAYSASKAAVIQFSRVAAREFGPCGIRINAVAPGPTDTPMLDPLMKRSGYREELIQRSALGAIGTPKMIAEAVITLMQLEWVTGQTLVVDGGSSLNTGRGNWQAESL